LDEPSDGSSHLDHGRPPGDAQLRKDDRVRTPLTKEQKIDHLTNSGLAIQHEGVRRGLDMARWTQTIADICADADFSRYWNHYAGFKFDIPAAWGVQASVELKMRPDADLPLGIRLDADISWSSTGRSISNAIVAVSHYNRVIEWAAVCEEIFNR